MSPSSSDAALIDNLSRDQMMSALFANLVLQQTNMASMFLGKMRHPETGQTVKDLEAARMFIDQLEMLEVKTKGNLSKEEASLLKESLMSLRLAFVEAVEKGETPPASPQPASASPAAAARPEAETASRSGPSPENQPAAGDDESKKKFVKKY